jgi:RNA polymerase sigma-70 factor (ECF subfamily)
MEGLNEALTSDLDGTFERLVRTFQNQIFGFALHLTDSRADAEEVAQDAFVRAYRALCSYPVERRATLALRPWLFRIALNVVHNRRRVRRVSTESLEDQHRSLVEAAVDRVAADPLDVVMESESLVALARSLAGLPERYRTAVLLRHVQGLSYLEAASVLNQPVGTVKANVHRGVLLLRKRLGRI